MVGQQAPELLGGGGGTEIWYYISNTPKLVTVLLTFPFRKTDAKEIVTGETGQRFGGWDVPSLDSLFAMAF